MAGQNETGFGKKQRFFNKHCFFSQDFQAKQVFRAGLLNGKCPCLVVKISHAQLCNMQPSCKAVWNVKF